MCSRGCRRGSGYREKSVEERNEGEESRETPAKRRMELSTPRKLYIRALKKASCKVPGGRDGLGIHQPAHGRGGKSLATLPGIRFVGKRGEEKGFSWRSRRGNRKKTHQLTEGKSS